MQQIIAHRTASFVGLAFNGKLKEYEHYRLKEKGKHNPKQKQEDLKKARKRFEKLF